MDFGIEADVESKSVEYDVHPENFLHDFVGFSRDNQVLNEEQALTVIMAVATGMLDDHEFYTSTIVTGGASSGKSHMLDEVIFEAMEYADDVHDHVYELTGGSDQAGVNDPEIDESRIGYFHELQKIPDEMLEFIKTVAEDGEFRYGRSVSDPDADGGFTTEHIERDPLPVIFSFADENSAEAGKDQELRSRTVEVKVDEGAEKNAAVHDMKWGGERITLDDAEHEYIRTDQDARDRAHVVKSHIRDMPINVDVVIPYGNGKFDGDDWTAADVVKPMFNFGTTDSTRASANLAGLTKGSTILNYHARDAVCEECQTVYEADDAQSHEYDCPSCTDASLHLIAEATDVGNLIAARNTLLATTHGLTEKKFAVLDAIRERGGQANPSGTAVQATKGDIIAEIQENDDIPTMTKSEITGILEELDENLIINIRDNPEDRRENLYVYDGSEVFEAPNIHEYYERFSDVVDPILDQPIEQTVAQQLDELNAKMDMQSMAESSSNGSNGGQTSLDMDEGGSDVELTEVEQHVAERLTDTIDGHTVPSDVMEDNTLKTQHMVGDTPVEYHNEEVRPSREPSGADRVDGFMSPDGIFEGEDDFNAVEKQVNTAIEGLREKNVLQMEGNANGSMSVNVVANL